MICVVVAHPDDEALSFGGAISILREAGAELFAVSLTNANDPVRAAEFAEFADRAGFGFGMLDYPDGGLRAFPAKAEGLSELLEAHGVRLAGSDCVVTHSPGGNERRHPQHVQTWRLLRQWCRERGVPLGFFAEEPVREILTTSWRPVAAGVSVARALPNVPALARHVATTSLRGPKLRTRLALRTWVDPGAEIRTVVRFTVDHAAKHRLLDAYGSQLAGLREYASYTADAEYLHLLGRRGLGALPWSVR